MKLMNVIIVIDAWCVTDEGPDAAHNAVAATRELLQRGELEPTQAQAIEVRGVPAVRPSGRDQRPIVAGTVSDEDFDKVRGKTVQAVYDLLNTRG